MVNKKTIKPGKTVETEEENFGAVLMNIPRTDAVYTNGHKTAFLRTLRELYVLINADTRKLSNHEAMNHISTIKTQYKVSITLNNKRIMNKNETIKTLNTLGHKMNLDAISAKESEIARIQMTNDKLRNMCTQLDGFNKGIRNSPNGDVSNPGVKFKNNIRSIIKFRRALKKIAHSPSTISFIDAPNILKYEDFENELLRLGIGDTTKSLRDINDCIKTSCELFVSELTENLPLLSESIIKDMHLETWLARTDLTNADIIELAFAMQTRLSSNNTESLAITEGFALTVNTLVSTFSLASQFGIGSDDESAKILNTLAKEALEQSKMQLRVVHREAQVLIRRIYGIPKGEVVSDEKLIQLFYILTVGVFMLFDLSGGIISINILDKLCRNEEREYSKKS